MYRKDREVGIQTVITMSEEERDALAEELFEQLDRLVVGESPLSTKLCKLLGKEPNQVG